jgi:ATP-dependent Zn protease
MDNQPHEAQNPPVRARTWLIWLAILGGIILLTFFKDRMGSQAGLINQAHFEELLDSGAIKQAVVNYGGSEGALNTIRGVYYATNGASISEVPFSAKVRLTAGLESRIFSSPQFEPHEPNTVLSSLLVSLLPIVLIAALIWFFFIRQIKKAGSRPSPQQERFDQILSKWEAQITRLDAILDKWERSQRERE